jgi:hypothetical protein
MNTPSTVGNSLGCTHLEPCVRFNSPGLCHADVPELRVSASTTQACVCHFPEFSDASQAVLGSRPGLHALTGRVTKPHLHWQPPAFAVPPTQVALGTLQLLTVSSRVLAPRRAPPAPEAVPEDTWGLSLRSADWTALGRMLRAPARQVCGLVLQLPAFQEYSVTSSASAAELARLHCHPHGFAFIPRLLTGQEAAGQCTQISQCQSINVTSLVIDDVLSDLRITKPCQSLTKSMHIPQLLSHCSGCCCSAVQASHVFHPLTPTLLCTLTEGEVLTGDSCSLICTAGYTPSAQTITCVDGTFGPATCTGVSEVA